MSSSAIQVIVGLKWGYGVEGCASSLPSKVEKLVGTISHRTSRLHIDVLISLLPPSSKFDVSQRCW